MSRRLTFLADPVSIADAVTALALPPPVYGVVPANWLIGSKAIPEFELEVWADAAVSLTNAQLYGAALHPKAIGATAMTSASASTNKVTKATHGYLTGDGPAFLTSDGTEPGGVLPLVPVWIVKSDADTFKLALSLTDALSGITIDLTTNGTGTLTLTGPDAQRVHWHSHGLLGAAGDGAIDLDAQAGYLVRRPHSPRAVAYAIVADLGSAVATSAAIFGIVDAE